MRARRTPLWRPVLFAAAAAIFFATLGGLMTDLGPWYENLRKPHWQPPGWLFGPVWTTIFALAAMAGVISWLNANSVAARRRVIALGLVNGLFNVLWSVLFFRLHRPDWSVIEVAPLWLSVLVMAIDYGRSARISSWLLLPYLFWVAFAGYLNWTIVALNAPFGSV
jgi:tryptophan-rich sensory protein